MTNAILNKKLNDLKNVGFFDNLIIERGIEKEFFRIDPNGNISKKSHPNSLGSALTNKFITTDFAEAQLELVTPTFEEIDELYDFLYSLHVFSAKNLKNDEMLWPFSMPPAIKNESEINLGYYHQSNIGLLKHVYRRGLKTRYGSTMQCVSGMHYNFSLKKESLQKLVSDNDQSAIDDAYLGLMRNFKRIFWFVLTQFGQTNVVDKSFVKGRNHNLKNLNDTDLYSEFATSLRMSDIGYQSKAQQSLDIKYNSLSSFLEKIKFAITSPYPDFEVMGLKNNNGDYHQISTGIIQIENEFYDSIRPKRPSVDGVRPYEMLKKLGIEYLEIRGVDISPFDIVGISKDQIRFLDLILIYCLVMPSPAIASEEKKLIDNNDKKALYNGRDENTLIVVDNKKVSIRSATKSIINDLKDLATFFVNCDEMTSSIISIIEMEKGLLPESGFHNDSLLKAKQNMSELVSSDCKYFDIIKKESESSLEEFTKMPTNTETEMNNFVKNYNKNL